MKIVLSTIVAAATVLLIQAQDAFERAETHSGAHWDYGGDPGGQTHWGLLDPSYVICDTGMHQSPIDINKNTVGTIATCAKTALIYDYKPLKNAIAHWNGHTVEVDWTSDASTAHNNSITIGAKKYNLVQFHLHTPSEHRINNRHADAELHMVHRSPDDGALAVVGVLLHAQYDSVPFFRYIEQLNQKATAAFTLALADEPADGPTEATAPVDTESQKNDGEEEQDEEDEGGDEDEDEYQDEDQENQDQNIADFESQEINWNLAEESSETVVSDDLLTADNNKGQCKHPHHPEDLTCTGGRVFGKDATMVDLKLKSVDFSPLLKAIGKFSPRWEYQGSLTTPPCSEHVSWNLMQRPFPIGLAQLKALVNLQGFNARDIHEDAKE
ncbi:hypothetical protein EMPS_08024 [Entomortierella parvispora]|uniref:carbonic anhydrase n=1 Tax=Entomortierella parvispora TaxID=205924 RepID=A0A9P3HF88_9FUNG|nr:hypothetical protein EMPS_08024 [Entomortierella parvispora]